MAGPDPSRPGRTQLSVYVTEPVADDLVAIATAMGISRSELARRVLEGYLADRAIDPGAAA